MKISIIITVSNHPQISKNALKSALTQDFEDYEIIFSNNSGVNLKTEVSRLSSKKVKYFETRRYLNNCDHWSFAFSKATGDWQLLLCDDDVLLYNKLKYLNMILDKYKTYEVFMWNYAFFLEREKKNRFSYLNENKDVEILDSQIIHKKIYNYGLRGKTKFISPFFPRVIYSKNLIKQINKNELTT